MLIAYGDHVQQPGVAHLQSLHAFCKANLDHVISHIHVLPFYPYSSDDGFAVIDFTEVDPKLGTWADVTELGKDFGPMFDYVLNHISSKSEWFTKFAEGDPEYRDYFITDSPDTDLSMVYRPRVLPLLSPVDTSEGLQYVWTTFGPDQIDLNYANPEVMLRMIDILLFYVGQGAEFVRMDAVTYIRKRIGTPSVHLPETHLTVQLFRDVLDAVAPNTRIITETNVPHADNIAYFGDGHNEAELVYNFALPPLLLHTLHTGDSTALSTWASSLITPSSDTLFFNFTASHDGIGVTPVKGILSPEQISSMVARVEEYGGLIGYRSVGSADTTNNSGTTYEPYEINSTLYNALSAHTDPRELANGRFMVSQAIALSLKGLPGIYLPSLFGSRNWYDGVEKGGYNRAINRQKFVLGTDLDIGDLHDPASQRGSVFTAYEHLLAVRSRTPAFHPAASMTILECGKEVFAVMRSSTRQTVTAVFSIANTVTAVTLPNGLYHDLISGQDYQTSSTVSIELAPYQILWLEHRS
jgi:sucrose phosphorylase